MTQENFHFGNKRMPTRKHIVIVDPASHTAELESFNRLVTKHPQLFTYHLPKMMGMSSLINIETQIDAIVILGSSCSVTMQNHGKKTLTCGYRNISKKTSPSLAFATDTNFLAHLEGARSYLFSIRKSNAKVFMRLISARQILQNLI